LFEYTLPRKSLMKGSPRTISFVFISTGLAVALAFAATYFFGSAVLKLRTETEARHSVIVGLEALLSTLKDAETGQRGYIITGNEAFLQPYERARRQLTPEVRDRMLKDTLLPVEEQEVIRQLIAQKLTELEQTIELRRSTQTEEAVAIVEASTGKDLMDELRERIGASEEALRASARKDFERANRLTSVRDTLFVLAAAISLGVIAWAYGRVSAAFEERETALHAKYGVSRD
jgi:CHASE3 domain sensor protein